MTPAIVPGATDRPPDRARLAWIERIQNPENSRSGSKGGPVNRKPIRHGARRVVCVAMIAGAVSFAAPALASAAVQTNGISGGGHAVQINGIQGTGHAARPNSIEGTG